MYREESKILMKGEDDDADVVAIVPAPTGFYVVNRGRLDDGSIDVITNIVVAWSVERCGIIKAMTLDRHVEVDIILCPDGRVVATMGKQWSTFQEFLQHVTGKPYDDWNDLCF